MLKVYIAGPMEGHKELNHPAFYAAAQAWTDAGWEAINPAEIEPNGQEWRLAMREDIKALVNCDAIAMLEDYNVSRGAMLEMNIAQALGLRVFNANFPVKYAAHPFLEKNECCNLVDYMHEEKWWSAL